MDKVVLDTLSQIIKQYLQDMFQLPLFLNTRTPPVLSDKPQFSTDALGYIGLAGDKHQGQLVLGFSKQFPVLLTQSLALPEQDSEEVREIQMSAVAELLNAIGGKIASNTHIQQAYPELSQTLPVVHENARSGSLYFTKSQGANLQFDCLGEILNVFFTLRAC